MAHVLPFPRGGRRFHWSRRSQTVAAGFAVLATLIALRLILSPPSIAGVSPVEIASAPPPTSADLLGPARVIDGDGLWINGVEVRLNGVDAFELRQTCGDVECGIEARRALHRMVADRTVACHVMDRDRYGRSVSACSVDGIDIGAALVREGHALAYTRYSTAYVDEEAAARADRVGAWAGTVTAPSDWRMAN